jgi:hypothetical protein
MTGGVAPPTAEQHPMRNISPADFIRYTQMTTGEMFAMHLPEHVIREVEEMKLDALRFESQHERDTATGNGIGDTSMNSLGTPSSSGLKRPREEDFVTSASSLSLDSILPRAPSPKRMYRSSSPNNAPLHNQAHAYHSTYYQQPPLPHLPPVQTLESFPTFTQMYQYPQQQQQQQYQEDAQHYNLGPWDNLMAQIYPPQQ